MGCGQRTPAVFSRRSVGYRLARFAARVMRVRENWAEGGSRAAEERMPATEGFTL